MTNTDRTIVVIESLAFTGTTWVNTLLGCHEESFAIGPPDKAWKMGAAEANLACVTCETDCPFWVEFVRSWEREKNFVEQLFEKSGRRVLVINNPTPAFRAKELEGGDFRKVGIHLVRDGRANIVSKLRHAGENRKSFYLEMTDWYRRSMLNKEALMAREYDEGLVVRYEDCVNSPDEQIRRMGEFIGLPLNSQILEYWKYEHHLVLGNTAGVGLLRELQGKSGFNTYRKEQFYDTLKEKMLANRGLPILDEAWKALLSEWEHILYELECGAVRERYQYPRILPDLEELSEEVSAAKRGIPWGERLS